MSDEIKILYVPRKPRKCPTCGFSPIASVQYGLPIYTHELEARMKAGKIVLGGCEMGFIKWSCIHCGQNFGKL